MCEDIRKQLFLLRDLKYKEFHSRLIPNIDPERVIGVRTPVLRKYVNTIYGTNEAEAFLKQLPHVYYEENNVHSCLIEKENDYETCIALLNEFLPYVNNWATCDMLSPKIFKRHLSELLIQISIWINSKHTYMVRFGIKMLMDHYLDEQFDKKYLDMVANVDTKEYYIQMMIAWYFATALAKQYESTLPYIENQRLSMWIHNKTIQKAVESNRISEDRKIYLKTLKRKMRNE